MVKHSSPFLFATKIKMCDKAVNTYPHTLKTHKMCDKAVDNHPSPTKYVPDRYRTEKMCYKAVNIYFVYLILVLINMKLNKYVT